MNETKVRVSERALVARINRVLAKRDEALRRCRADSRWFYDLGTYYTVNFRYNAITGMRLDLEEVGRSLEVLRNCDVVATEEIVHE